MPKIPMPEPVIVEQVCSECGLDWSLHPENATLIDCVRLLKERPQPVQWYPYYPNTSPWWSPTITYSGHNTVGNVAYLSASTTGEDPPDDAVPAAV